MTLPSIFQRARGVGARPASYGSFASRQSESGYAVVLILLVVAALAIGLLGGKFLWGSGGGGTGNGAGDGAESSGSGQVQKEEQVPVNDTDGEQLLVEVRGNEILLGDTNASPSDVVRVAREKGISRVRIRCADAKIRPIRELQDALLSEGIPSEIQQQPE